LIVIEDCAESHGASVNGKMTGNFGDLNCFSFYANKIITTGEGGMVTTNNEEMAKKLRLLRNLAFTNPRFFHEEAGYNFRMTGYQAAMGLTQVRKIEKIIADKRKVASLYNKYLQNKPGIKTPFEAAWARNVYWMYGIVVNPEFGITRNELVKKLSDQGIDTRTFFCPMNIQPCVQRVKGFRQIDCPIAEDIWENGLYLPSSTNLTEDQIAFISDAIIN